MRSDELFSLALAHATRLLIYYWPRKITPHPRRLLRLTACRQQQMPASTCTRPLLVRKMHARNMPAYFVTLCTNYDGTMVFGWLNAFQWIPRSRSVMLAKRETPPFASGGNIWCSVRTRMKNGTGDANDIWKIMIVGGRENDTILTVTSKLLIVHYLQNCALTTSGKQLPKWGFEQQEVSCNPNIRDQNAYWNVEDNVFEKCKYTRCERAADTHFAVR